MLPFNLQTPLPPVAAIEALERQLAKRSVVVAHGSDNSLMSTSIALPLLSPDRRSYSRDNWVGLNPFVYLSSVAVVASCDPSGQTNIAVSVSLLRFWTCVFICLVLVLPIFGANLGAGMAALVFVALGVTFIREVVIKRALPAELLKALRERSNQSLNKDAATSRGAC
jgi:hypothetical protein